MRDPFQLGSSLDEAPIEVDEAQSRILRAVLPLAATSTPLEQALGRILAEPIVAPHDVPGYVSSAMDGYAVHVDDFSDHATTLPVVADIPAGSEPEALRRGAAARVMTGGAVPSGATAVVPVEWTDAGETHVLIRRRPASGANIRPSGDDISAGTLVLDRGDRLDPAAIGVLASLGYVNVLAHQIPTVAVLSTGDELVEAHEPRRPGQVVNSNAWTLESLVRSLGWRAAPRAPIVRDDLEAGVAALRKAAASADVILTTGAVSVGAKDWVRPALETLGAERLFWRVAMKPGKPIVAAAIGEKLFIGLPGNPVSCMVGFHLFVAPALRRLAGTLTSPLPPSVRCVVRGSVPPAASRREYIRMRVRTIDGVLTAEPLKGRGSGMLSSMLRANGLGILLPDSTSVGSGGTMNVVLIGPIEA